MLRDAPTRPLFMKRGEEMNYVIIGNSAAAVGCIEGIRRQDREGPITVISAEPYHTYSRPLISYLLGGKATEETMRYRPLDFYEKNGCTLLAGKTAAQILPEEKAVLLDDGSKVTYDKLLVATGSSPFMPPMKGVEQVKNCFTFLSIEDVKALKGAITPEAKVLIVGAGLIGLKCAQGLHHKVAQITVVDIAPRILPSILDEEGSAIVQRHIEGKGIRFLLSQGVQEFEGGRAILTNGGELEFDVLVIAVGVRPNTGIVAQAGGIVAKGIVTNEHCETSLEDVYAAGDCAESYDLTIGGSRVLALLPNAYMQGECAGICMAGGEKAYNKAIPMNAIDFFGLHMITAGSYDGQAVVLHSPSAYKKLVCKDNLLKGYIMLGDVARAGIYTSLIREQVPLDTIDFELIKEKPQLMAFSKKERAAKLGGAAL